MTPGCDARDEVLRRDLQDPVHALERQRDAAVEREHAARLAAPRRDRDRPARAARSRCANTRRTSSAHSTSTSHVGRERAEVGLVAAVCLEPLRRRARAARRGRRAASVRDRGARPRRSSVHLQVRAGDRGRRVERGEHDDPRDVLGRHRRGERGLPSASRCRCCPGRPPTHCTAYAAELFGEALREADEPPLRRVVRARPRRAERPEIDATFTIRPRRRDFIPGIPRARTGTRR